MGFNSGCKVLSSPLPLLQHQEIKFTYIWSFV